MEEKMLQRVWALNKKKQINGYVLMFILHKYSQ